MLINRDYYLNKIHPYYCKDVIKVITGQRRSGKSSILQLIYDKLSENHVFNKLIYINKELHEFNHIRTSYDLVFYVKEQSPENGRTALFIDEVQDIDKFEIALRSFLAEGNYDIYCSGSNSTLLSGELATLLSGRFIEFRVYTLTYSEFLIFHNLKSGNESLNLYFQFGGLPFLRNIDLTQEITKDYIDGIYRTVLLKDIINRYNVRNPYFLELLSEYCADNIGSLITAKNISDYLKSQNMKIAPNTVLDYLQYFVNACFMHRVRRYDLKGKRILETNDKYYFEDIGIRNHIAGFQITDMNKVLENVLFHHLTASGYTVTVGAINNLEIDFVAEKDREKIYIQVCYLLQNSDTIAREFNSLKKISDNYPKLVVSMDPQFSGSIDGIVHMHVLSFLNNFPFDPKL